MNYTNLKGIRDHFATSIHGKTLQYSVHFRVIPWLISQFCNAQLPLHWFGETTVALENDAYLLHNNRDFDAIATHFPLKFQ